MNSRRGHTGHHFLRTGGWLGLLAFVIGIALLLATQRMSIYSGLVLLLVSVCPLLILHVYSRYGRDPRELHGGG
jgi:hypothetical protein